MDRKRLGKHAERAQAIQAQLCTLEASLNAKEAEFKRSHAARQKLDRQKNMMMCEEEYVRDDLAELRGRVLDMQRQVEDYERQFADLGERERTVHDEIGEYTRLITDKKAQLRATRRRVQNKKRRLSCIQHVLHCTHIQTHQDIQQFLRDRPPEELHRGTLDTYKKYFHAQSPDELCVTDSAAEQQRQTTALLLYHSTHTYQ